MFVNFIGGGVGSGKTRFCADLMRRTLEKNPGDRCIMLVPDQLSYTAEKTISELLGGTGPNGAEVMTLSRFISRVLNPDPNRYLTPSGKQMLIYEAAAEQEKKEHRIFNGCLFREGFLEKLSELMVEMSRYCITPEILAEQAGKVKSGMLREKLSALSDIQKSYQLLLDNRFLDSADDLLRLAEKISSEELLSHTHIWFDDFSDFSPAHYAVLRAMMKHAASVHITLCMPRDAGEDSIFCPVVKTYHKLMHIAEEEGVRVFRQWTDSANRRLQSDTLRLLQKHWREDFSEKKPVDAISLYQARDRYGEVEWLSKKILSDIQNGLRYRDIRVICGEEESYHHIIEAVFSDYRIPYFSDRKIPVTEHPIVVTALSVFEIQKANWSYESVFAYLRCGFLYTREDGEIKPFLQDDLDQLENYVLRYGIRGKKAWCSQWEQENTGVFDSVLGTQESGEDMEYLNRIRRMVTEPLMEFYDAVKGRTTVRQAAEALYEFFCRIHLYEGLQKEVAQFEEQGFINEAEQFQKIWNLLLSVMDQAVVTSGGRKKSDFPAILRAGLSAETISIIPSGIDRVTIGAMSRNSFPPVRKTYFLGCLEGCIPHQVEGNGILTDPDRIALGESLSEDGRELAKDSRTQMTGEEWKLYRAIFSSSNAVCFSWPALDSEGNACQAASFLEELLEHFPNMVTENHLEDEKSTEFYSEKHAFSAMMRQLGNPDPAYRGAWNEFYQECRNNPAWQNRLELFSWAHAYKRVQPKLFKEEAARLYGAHQSYSASKLSVFRACPFSYYIQYGLKAKEREIHQIHKFDLGRLLHWAVCRYCEEVSDGETELSKIRERWCALTEEKSQELVHVIMQEIEVRVLRDLHRDREKVAYLLERMEKTILRSAEMIRLSMIRGEYAVVALELEFKIEIEWNGKHVELNGVIDRVDLEEKPEEESARLRIVDYKSGNKDFSIISISNQMDMQLVLYAIAALSLYQSGVIPGGGYQPEISGILYHKLRDDLVECKPEQLSEVDAIARRSLRMDGLIVLEDTEDAASEALEMDHTLLETDGSEFLKLSLKSDKKGINQNRSKVTTKSRFARLMDYVKKSIIDLDEKIYDGEIRICPGVQGTQSSCSYCSYREICLYEKALDGQDKLISDEKEAWHKIEEIGEEGNV